MNEAERTGARERFRALMNSPAIQNSLRIVRKNPDPNDGDTRTENTKLPSNARFDAVTKAIKGAF